MPYVALNNAASTLSGGVAAIDTAISVQIGHGAKFAVGANYSYLTLQDASSNIEIVKLTSVTGDVLNVVRAQDGTAARVWGIGDTIGCRPCAAGFNDFAVGPQITNSTSKVTPVDADELPLTDSAATFGLKKLTWANLKSTLVTYFNTLFTKRDGSNATGTWSINTSGNAATATNATTAAACSGNSATATLATNASGLNSTALAVANTWAGTQTFNGGNINGGGAASTYGAISINGTKAAWGGVNFRSGTTNYGTLMMGSTTQGFFNAADNAWLLQWDQSGNFTATANVTAYSDERLKKNWTNLADDFIQRLAKVKHGTYDRLDIEQRQVGVSAQSLREVMPEAIMLGADDMLSVAYGNAALAACVQLAKEVVLLRERIEMLEACK